MLFKFGKLDALCRGALLVSTRVAIQTSALNTWVSLNINCTLVFCYNAFMLSLNLLLFISSIQCSAPASLTRCNCTSWFWWNLNKWLVIVMICQFIVKEEAICKCMMRKYAVAKDSCGSHLSTKTKPWQEMEESITSWFHSALA